MTQGLGEVSPTCEVSNYSTVLVGNESDEMIVKSHRFWFRSTPLLGEILAIVDDEGEVSLPALVDEVLEGSDAAERTVRGAIAELSAAGVLWLSMPARRGADRVVRFSLLGGAWFRGVLDEVPGLGGSRDAWGVFEDALLEDGE